MGLWSLCDNSFLLSFRGAAGDEESRSALKTLRARFLASLGKTVERRISHKLFGPPRAIKISVVAPAQFGKLRFRNIHTKRTNRLLLVAVTLGIKVRNV